MSKKIEIKHNCKKCAEDSKWYAELSEGFAEEMMWYAKKSREYAEKCRCEKK